MSFARISRWYCFAQVGHARHLHFHLGKNLGLFDARFYQTGAFVGGFACQGDIVRLTSAAPCIDAAGNAIVTDVTFDHWMILGNTCDMDRADELRSQIAPLVALADPVPDEHLRALRRYAQFKWSNGRITEAMSAIYGLRSEALHESVPFPPPMTGSVQKFGDGYQERPLGFAAGDATSWWASKDLPMNLHLFEYITRNVLLKWWRSVIPTV
jgi:hypothetical protein